MRGDAVGVTGAETGASIGVEGVVRVGEAAGSVGVALRGFLTD
ncbi:hypothetical protein NIES2104_52550 [Leptolyngbya sp. NIES-2104]|nr:hypothetical protein NIES2104_52550 [Leptolyngbya sp. NIES-2104]